MPKLFSLTVFLLWLPSLMASNKPVSGSEGSKKDTVSAVVLYGEEVLFEAVEGQNDQEIIALRDSLLLHKGANQLSSYIDLYLSLKNKSEQELHHYIDSLFEVDAVPYALINQINIFLANRPERVEPFLPSDLYIGAADQPIPADTFYHQWNTSLPNPYKPNLGADDTTINLLLQSPELGTFHIPIENVITSRFGWRDGRNHNGIDLDLEVWDPVVACFPGVVRIAKTYGGYGRVVVVRHYNGLETYYAHLHRFKVKAGDKVEAGQVIGLGGSSGHSTGSHLHFEVRFRGKPINPQCFISFEEKALVNDTLVLRRVNHNYVAYPKGVLVHKVKRGDTLYEIAKTYGTTTHRIAELNGIRRNEYLYVGQRLRVI